MTATHSKPQWQCHLVVFEKKDGTEVVGGKDKKTCTAHIHALHLESSKQNYYIISLRVMITAIFIHSHTHTCTHMHTHPSPPPIHTHTQTNTHTHMPTHPHTNTHTHTHKHTNTQTHKHTVSHTHTHLCTRTRARSHKAFTHIQKHTNNIHIHRLFFGVQGQQLGSVGLKNE